MSAKDTVIGTTKRLVAEIVGDGNLAEEGLRQADGNIPHFARGAEVAGGAQDPEYNMTVAHGSVMTDTERFALLLGHAALSVWSDLPRDAQERLFAAAVDDGIIANSLAVFLHDRHPKTVHPPNPPQVG